MHWLSVNTFAYCFNVFTTRLSLDHRRSGKETMFGPQCVLRERRLVLKVIDEPILELVTGCTWSFQ